MSLYFKNKKIWIIGGSRGIGLGLARELSRRGARVIISARRAPQEKFAHEFIALDVTDRKKLKSLCDKMTDLDGVIYSSGVLSPSSVADIDEKHLAELLAVNVIPSSLLAAYLGKKLEARRGFFVFMGSVAGIVGLPFSQPYGGGKDYLKNFAETVAVEYPKLKTHLVAPGYVATDMISGNNFRMPLIYSVKKAVRFILFGIATQKFYIRFPWAMHSTVQIICLTPIFIRRLFWKYFGKMILKS